MLARGTKRLGKAAAVGAVVAVAVLALPGSAFASTAARPAISAAGVVGSTAGTVSHGVLPAGHPICQVCHTP